MSNRSRMRGAIRGLGTLAFGLVCFVLGAVTEPTLGAVGERLRDWILPEPAVPNLWFEPIREYGDGRLLFYVSNSGSRHAAVMHIDFCPPRKWQAAKVDAEQELPSLDSSNPEDGPAISGINWKSGDWRLSCRSDDYEQILRVLEGSRGIPADGSTELKTEAPTGWTLIAPRVDGGMSYRYSADQMCGVTLIADDDVVYRAIPCEPKKP